MQPCSWLLLTDPGWSKFTSKSSITDFLKKYFFLWKNVTTAKSLLLAETFTFWNSVWEMLVDPRQTIWSERETSQAVCSMFRALSWATGERSALSPWRAWPRAAARICLSQFTAWPRIESSFPRVRSHSPQFMVSVGMQSRTCPAREDNCQQELQHGFFASGKMC